jgi:DNA-binding response OmpR family regulator
MLTARGEEIDRILGLEMGADDYIVKPFSPREVISRIKAVLRRTAPQAENAHAPQQELTTLHFGSLEIQPERYSVRIGGAPVNLTPREVDVLTLLASNPGRVFDRDQILSRVWGYDFFGDTRTVDTHIKRLRQKIDCEEMGKKWDIVTVYGKGYKFEVLE